MSLDEDFLSFDSKSAKSIGSELKSYKFQEGPQYRITLAWHPIVDGLPVMEKSPVFMAHNTIWVDRVGSVVVPKDKAQADKIVRYSKNGDEPKLKIGTIIIKWPVNQSGKTPSSLDDLLADAEIHPLVMSGDKFKQFRTVNNDFPAHKHDVGITLEKNGAQYQKYTVQAKPDTSILLKLLTNYKETKNPKLKDFFEDFAAQVSAIASQMPRLVGRVFTPEELALKVSGDNAPGPVVSNEVSSAVDDQVDAALAGIF